MRKQQQQNKFDKLFYKTYANKLTKIKKLAKKLYFASALGEKKHNPIELWQFIKSIISTKNISACNSLSSIIVDNDLIDKPKEISQHFNDYFVKIGHSISNSINSFNSPNFATYLKNSVTLTIVLEPPSAAEIFNIINLLHPHKTCGHDNMLLFFLRLGGEILAPIFSVYFKCAFKLGIFPQNLKTAKVIPVFKAGNKQLLQNFRPISFLPSISKILEKLIKIRFSSTKFYMTSNMALEISTAYYMLFWMLQLWCMMKLKKVVTPN